MNEEIQTQINKLTRTLANEQQITAGQVASIIRGLASVLIDNKKKAEKLNAQTVKEVSDLYDDLEKEHEKIMKAVETQTVTVKNSVMAEIKEALKEVRMNVIAIQESKPQDGKDADEEAIANRVMEMIVMPEVQEVVMDDGATIIRKINECEETIEEAKVEGLADLKTQVQMLASMPQGVGKPFGGGASGIKDIVAGSGVTVTKNNGKYTISASGASGDVVGPASATDNAIARFDSTTGKLIQNSGPQITDDGELDMNTGSIGFTMQTATGDGTTTIDWGSGNHFDFTFGAANETFTFTDPANPGVFTLSLTQDSVGSRTATWPASVKWPAGTAPTLTTTATTGYDIIAFRFDGTNYYGTSTLNFS